MNRSLLATLATTLLLCAASVAAPLRAASAILRCQSADGTLVYTDTSCSAFGAKAAPMSGTLLNRIYHDEARFGETSNAQPQMTASIDRRDPSSGCARTPTQLAMDLRGSLALGDVNRVAESYHWVGMSSQQGERTLDHLQRLVGKPVLSSHYFDAQIGMAVDVNRDAGMAAPSVVSDAGMLQLVLAGGATQSAIDFDVHKYAGCYFVTF